MLLNGHEAKPSARVRKGDEITVAVPPPEPSGTQAEEIPLDVLYEDSHIIAINKAKGMSAHPSSSERGGTLVNALVHYCGDSLSGIGGVQRPGIVHRLDKDTSGVMLVAKTDAAHAGLASQFSERTMEKHYLAIVHGRPARNSGDIDAPVGRDPRNRKRMTVLPPGKGREAFTEWKVEERFESFSTIDAHPRTGRTHQVRVHFAHIGHPLAGDTLYGGRKARSKLKPDDPRRLELQRRLDSLHGQALHARSLAFTHPITGAPMLLEAPLPPDMSAFLEYIMINESPTA